MTIGTFLLTAFFGTFVGIIICILMITAVENIVLEEGKGTSRSRRIVMLVASLIIGMLTVYNLIN